MTRLKDQLPLDKFVSRQVRLWEQTYEKRKVERESRCLPCITISKEIGSQGVELAHRLAKRLNWRLFDKDLVEYIAQNAHVQSDMVEIFDEKTQSEIHNWVVTLLDRYALASDKYFKHLITVITTIGKHGHAIVVGRGANFILSPQRTLRVKTVAPIPQRIAHVMQKQNMSRPEALGYVAKMDKDRQAFMRRFFHQKADDPLAYDLVINMATLDLQVASEIVVQALKTKFSNPNFN